MKETLIKLREVIESYSFQHAFFCNRMSADLDMSPEARVKVLNHLWPIALELGASEDLRHAWGRMKNDCNDNSYKEWKLQILDTAIERL